MRERNLAIVLLAAAGLLRLVLLLLPELGRDEVTYLYWTHHPRPDYAPLLQGQIALARWVSELPWFLRLSQFIVGAVGLVLFAQWLRARGAEHRWLAVGALATVPWLCFSGAILHPDGLFVCGLMIFALGVERTQARWVIVGAVLCLGARLTGIVPAGVALLWLLQQRRVRPAVALSAVLVTWAVLLQPTSITAARDFAQIDAGPVQRLAILLLEIGLLGGLLLAVARWRRNPVALVAVILLAGFTIAALGPGQVKANWLLPGFLLLWPQRPRRGLLIGLAVISLAFSTLMVAGYARPQWAAAAERSLDVHGLLPAYSDLAGQREARVASAASWRDYLEGFHGQVEWPPLPSIPDQIKSDDYAIAARLALKCPATVPVVVVPGDPLFAAEAANGPLRELVVAVRVDLDDLVQDGQVVWRGTMRHPVTASTIRLALVERNNR